MRRVGLDSKCKRCVNKISEKIFFNPLIRYLLLNTLKFTIVSLIVFRANKPSTTDLIVSIAILSFIGLITINFVILLRCMSKELGKEMRLRRFGTLYQGKNVNSARNKVYLVPFAFFIRRIAFGCTTVFLFYHPHLQFIAHHLLTMAMIVYLASSVLS